MKVYKDDRGEHDLERKIEQLQLKIRTYQELIKDTKALKFKITTLESEIIKKDNLIQGMQQIITDLSEKKEEKKLEYKTYNNF